MKFFRIIFFPFLVIIQICYFAILFLRNTLYNYKIYSTTYFKNITIISVGSLKLGGAGKTPLVEYLIKILPTEKIALLSRGYKRKSKGFILARENHSSSELGDEANQVYKKNLNLTVAVDTNRVRGVQKIIKTHNKKIILLDDGHQHRKLGRDLNILVTEYEKLYTKDHLLPLGNLREPKSGAKRANMVVVTKCPKNISIEEKKTITASLYLEKNQSIFFSYIKKYKFIYNHHRININTNEDYLLITGIANPNPLLKTLKNKKINYLHFKYSDHYFFKNDDINYLIEKGKKTEIKNLILTEKDFYRLSKENLRLLKSYFKLFYTQIEFDFIEEEKELFNKQILKFI